MGTPRLVSIPIVAGRGRVWKQDACWDLNCAFAIIFQIGLTLPFAEPANLQVQGERVIPVQEKARNWHPLPRPDAKEQKLLLGIV